MPNRFTVQHREIGMLRIYMKPSDRIGERSLRTLWAAKPLYRELIQRASSMPSRNTRTMGSATTARSARTDRRRPIPI